MEAWKPRQHSQSYKIVFILRSSFRSICASQVQLFHTLLLVFCPKALQMIARTRHYRTRVTSCRPYASHFLGWPEALSDMVTLRGLECTLHRSRVFRASAELRKWPRTTKTLTRRKAGSVDATMHTTEINRELAHLVIIPELTGAL
jgi:hypothetical protein